MIYQGKEASIFMIVSDDMLTFPYEIQQKIERYERKTNTKINILDIKFIDYGSYLTAMIIVEGKEVGEASNQDICDYLAKQKK